MTGGARGPDGGGVARHRRTSGAGQPAARGGRADSAATHRQSARRRRRRADARGAGPATPGGCARRAGVHAGRPGSPGSARPRHATAAPAAQPGGGHRRLRALLAVADHRRRCPAQPRGLGLQPGVRDGVRPRRAPGPRRVGPPLGAVRAGPGGRLACRPDRPATGHSGRWPADPRRRLQRDPRPQSNPPRRSCTYCPGISDKSRRPSTPSARSREWGVRRWWGPGRR